MKRHCVAEDEFIGDGAERCGLEFDDVERSVICPHPYLWPQFPTWVELLLWACAMAHYMETTWRELEWQREHAS